MMIREIPADVARAVKSQQYVHNLFIIVKELIENSLDAHSSKIKIQLNDKIIVEDDGDGIEDLLTVCQCGYTSKEDTSYSVLHIENKDSGFSHGFRGQALSSIRELCDIEISTRVRPTDTGDNAVDGLGMYRDFQSGVSRPYPREYGTTVKVSNLFKNCAVRRRLNEKSMKKHCAQVLSLVQSFCYTYDVAFTVIEKNRLLCFVQGSSNTREYSIKKHGEVYLEVEEEYFSLLLFPLSKDKSQVIVLEKRIISCNRLSGMINTLFKRYFDYIPTFVLSLRDSADVNMSVDKSEAVIKNMKFVESKIRSEMDLYFSQRLFIHQTQANDRRSDPIVQDIPLSEQSLKPLNEENSLTHDDRNSSSFNGCNSSFIDSYTPSPRKERPVTVNIEDSHTALGNIVSSNITQSQDFLSEREIERDTLHRPSTISGGNSEIDYSSPLTGSAALKTLIETDDGSRHCNISAYSIIKEEALMHPNVQIERSDFRNMAIIGQFNQGFILCTLKKDDTSFLLTVDQHAADEIYNFEGLQNSFCLKKQKLITPIPLELTPIQILTVEGNTEVFAKNGFTVESNSLLTIPVYKGHFFTVKDFYSLLENIPLEIYESDKFREIMASKACRSSVMIGTGLSLQGMRKVVDNLSGLKRPWNCPHGRPTFKILTKL